MRRIAPPRDGLRSTPSSCGGRDAVMFPEADAAYRTHGAPTTYCLVSGIERVTLCFEQFHLPYWLSDSLRTRHWQYLDTWARQAP